MFSYFFNTFHILGNWKKAKVTEDDMKCVGDWRREMDKRQSTLPDGTEWRPGFEDDGSIW